MPARTLFPSLFARVFNPGLRIGLALMIALAGLLMGGCSTASTESDNLMLFADNAPMPKIVARGAELAAAEQAAKQMHGCFAVQGEGCSMEPVYVSGTAVVIRAGGYDRLHRGQPVVYKSSRGFTVAHMLVRQTENGWVAAGLNNNGEDTELVTTDNLVGVITQAYASKTGSLPKAVAARIALNTQIRGGRQVASLGL
jgi:hypothetical protein